MLGMTEAFVGGGALEDGEPSSRLVEGTRTESTKRMGRLEAVPYTWMSALCCPR